MDTIMEISKKHDLFVIEDAAQGFDSYYKKQRLGTIGSLGALSFHETKNIISGEGGALFVNDKRFMQRAEILREKGTNRSKFFRGEVDKYTWVDIGSSYLPSDMIASFLFAQLNNSILITQKRVEIWGKYNNFFKQYEDEGIIKRPFIPKYCRSNSHMFYVVFNSLKERNAFILHLKENDIMAVFHYVPLHSSPAGKQYGKTPFSMDVTNKISDTIVRMPLYFELSDDNLGKIFKCVKDFMKQRYGF
jgi:dTDP-4-amino-4,6-dideoxygalactose transaminase